MELVGVGILQEFWSKHRDAEPALKRWIEVVSRAHWGNFMECRQTFRSADQVRTAAGTMTVFNIKGNRYRLVAAVGYSLGQVVVSRVMTHEEYSEERWKEQS